MKNNKRKIKLEGGEEMEVDFTDLEKTINSLMDNEQNKQKLEGERENLFKIFAQSYKTALDKSLELHQKFQIDLLEYEESYCKAIYALMELCFTEEQIEIIDMWKDGMKNLQGEEIKLKDNKGKEISLKTIEQLWKYINTLK